MGIPIKKSSIKRILKIILIVLLILGSLHYAKFIITTPIEYVPPETDTGIELSVLLESIDSGKFENIIFGLPFKSKTQQELDLNVVRITDNTFELNSKMIIFMDGNFTLLTYNFLNKSRVLGLPDIYLNDNKINLIDRGDFYGLEELKFLKSDKPNVFEIKNLDLIREKYDLGELIIPLFFNRENYVFSINLPQMFPIFISKGDKTDWLQYRIEIPKHKRIDKETSGWQNIIVPRNPQGPNIIAQSQRYGLINQEIDDISEDNYVTFKTKISTSNPYSSFEVTFLPDYSYFILIILLLLTPIGTDISLRWRNNFNKRGFLIVSYGFIIVILGGFSIFNYGEIFFFFQSFIEYSSVFFLVALVLLPVLYLKLTNFKK